MNINLNVWPHVAKNGAEVSVLWSGISDPRPDDYIAYYCPFYDNPNHYLDYVYGKDIPGWGNGYGHYEVGPLSQSTHSLFWITFSPFVIIYKKTILSSASISKVT